MLKEEEINNTQEAIWDLYSFDQSFTDYLRPNKNNSFYILLKKKALTENLLPLIEEYGNTIYAIIKPTIKHRLNEKKKFTDYLENKEVIFGEIEAGIKNSRLSKFTNFVKDYQEILTSLEYFFNFEDSFSTEQLGSIFLENQFTKFKENASYLKSLLSKLESPSIDLYLSEYPLLIDDEKNPAKLAQHKDETSSATKIAYIPEYVIPLHENESTSLGNRASNIIVEPDFCYRLEKSSMRERFVLYLRKNPKKIILGSILGAGIAGVSVLLWPVSLTILAGGILAGALTGGVVVGALHYSFSEETRDSINSPKKIPVNFNNLQPSEKKNINQNSKNDLSKSNVALNLERNIEKENLIRFLSLMNESLTPGLLFSQKNEDLISLINSLAKCDLNKNKSMFELAIKYLLKNDNILSSIDFNIVSRACLKDFRKLDVNKYFKIDSLKSNIQLIKEVYYQLKKEGKTLEHLQKLNESDFLTLKRKPRKIDPFFEAYKYFSNLASNKGISREHLENLSDVYPEEWIRFVQEKNNIRYVFGYFVTKNQKDFYKINEFDDKQLLEIFIQKITKLKKDQVATIYLELMITPGFDNYKFLPRFIQESLPELKNILLCLDERYWATKKSLCNCIHLFLNAVTPVDELPINKENAIKMIAKLYEKLNELDVNQVVNIFSEIRFNMFTQLDMNEFQNLIKQYYHEKENVKLKEFSKGIDKLNQPEFIEKNIKPLLIFIRSFLQAGATEPMVLEKKQSKELLQLLFDKLDVLSVQTINAILKKLLQEVSWTSEQTNFFSQLIFNYFEFKQPDKLTALIINLESIRVENDLRLITKPCLKFALTEKTVENVPRTTMF